jgi:GlcNAc-P-P-Und epimerase
MKKILITGASGFIGTNLLEKFVTDGFKVLNVDYKQPVNKSHIQYWENIDITNFFLLKKCIEKFAPNYIVHLAARTDLDGSSHEDYNANISGVENLMKIVETLPFLKKIIVTSSMLVCHTGYNPVDQFDYSPTTIYGESKVETEKKVWKNLPKCDWAIIRPTSIWGPWFDIPYKNFFDMIIDGKYFHIGDKGCTKTYGYVGNSIYQIEQILFSETKSIVNKVFYIGDYNSTNIEEWANEIALELNSSIKKVPFCIMKIIAIVGDILKILRIKFPMTSFRLKNMTTDNKINLTNTRKIAPNLPYSRLKGVKKTINWIKIFRKIT